MLRKVQKRRSGARKGSKFNKILLGGSPAQMKKKCLAAVSGNERVPSSLPFPGTLKCVLTYDERFPLFINNSASSTVYQYRGNDLFDPNFTGTGGQPTYFDQLSALYNRFRVYASAIRVIGYNTTTAQTTYVDMCVVPSAINLAAFTTQDAISLPRAKFTSVNVNHTKTLTEVATTSEILGVKDVEGADRLQALKSASPSETWLWSIFAHSYDGLTASSLGIDVRISYYCEFFDRIAVSQSLLERKRLIEQKEDALYVSVPSTPANSSAGRNVDAAPVSLRSQLFSPVISAPLGQSKGSKK